MRVLLLGRVGADVDGHALAVGGPKQQAVLALLALNAGRVVSLDRLIQELWSDEPPARATMAVQSHVSRLRRVLAAVPTTDGPPVHLVTRSPGWVLQVPPTHVDALEFTALVTEGDRLLDEGHPAAAAARLHRALDLWTGPALGEADPAGFAADERARLDQLRLDATELQLRADLAAGADGRVVDDARRFVADNPYRERGWMALMLALYRSGRQADALAAAARLRAVLAEDLGLDPSPEVQELETAILRQDPSVRSQPDPGGTDDHKAAPSTDEAADAAVDGAGPLAGRDDVLAILAEVLAQAGRGRGRAVVVEGSAGIGKSTVLRELDGLGAAVGGRTLHGAGVPTETAAPALWPWVDILRELLVELPDLAGDPSAAALAQLDPALVSGPASPIQAGDRAFSRTRLYRAVVDLLALARERFPLTVVVDDAQWLDQETSELLAVAVPELTARGVLFAFGFRSDESTGDEDALAVLGRIRRDAVVRLRLRGLDEAEVADVIERISGRPTDEAVTRAITRRTAGNPLFVTELVRLLVSQRRLDPAGVYAFLPAGTREVLQHRLDRLPEGTRSALVVAAFVGRPVDVDVLRQVTGMDEEAVLDACDSAVSTGFLLEDADTPGSFVLTHDLVRQTLVESVSTARGLRLHARVGQALMDRQAQRPEVVVEVARHFAAAASVVGPAEAVRHLVAAADYELAGLFFDRARGELDAALALASSMPPGAARAAVEQPVQDRLSLLSLYTAGPAAPRPGPGGTSPTTVVPLDVEDPTAWYVAMFHAIISADYTQAVAGARAVDRADLPRDVAALVRWSLGLAEFELGAFESAEQHLLLCDTFLEDGDDLGLAELFSFSTSVPMFLALIHHFRHDEPAADQWVRRARRRAVRSSADVVALDFSCAWLFASRGDVPAAGAAAAACVDHAEEARYPAFTTMGLVVRGWATAMSGDAAGLEVMDGGYEGYVADGRKMHGPVLLVLRAEAHEHHGRLQVARDLVSQATALAADTGERVLGPRLEALAARLAVAAPATDSG